MKHRSPSGPRLRRSEFFFIEAHDEPALDVSALLNGSLEIEASTEIHAVSAVTGDRSPLSEAEVHLLFNVPSRHWTRATTLARRLDAPVDALLDLANAGLLLSDDKRPEMMEQRLREERLSSARWSPLSAMYHFASRWKNVDAALVWPRSSSRMRAELERSVEKHVEAHGPPPHHFHRRRDADVREPLPFPCRGTAFFDLLGKRKTTRAFSRRAPVDADDLSTCLYYAFGCHGTLRLSPDVTLLKKTSPSGGALHPIEAYLLVNRVSGLASGLYHYNVRDHALDRLARMSQSKARELARRFTAGQAYASSAAALVILAARFVRNFWKYQFHARAYRVLLMETGHLSQTLYLLSAELGLGTFVTAAINASEIEAALGLDGVTEGVLAVCGLGKPDTTTHGWELEPAPFRPRTGTRKSARR